MLQASVQSVSSFSDICCKSMFQLFYSYVAVSIFMLQVFYLDVAYVSHICFVCFYLDVAYILHICCKCFIRTLRMFVMVFKCF